MLTHVIITVFSMLAVFAMMAAAFMVTVDVLFRKFAGLTMSGSDEYSGYVFSATTTWAFLRITQRFVFGAGRSSKVMIMDSLYS